MAAIPISQLAIPEPSARSFQQWTPALIKSAEVLADGGSLMQAADLCDEMLADDRLLAVLNKRVQGVLGLEVTFEASRGRRKPVKALDVGEDWWEMFPESELGELVKWGTLLGVGVGRINWKEHENRVVGVLEPWHPRNLKWDPQKRAWFARLTDGTWTEVTPGDGSWVLYTPYGKKRPWAKGLWRGLARWWLLKQYAIVDWALYSERHGQGYFVAEPQPGMTPTAKARDELAKDMQGMGRAPGIAMPAGFNFKLVESVANNWQTFNAQKDAANVAFAIALLGNNLSTELSQGSFAAADVHKVVEITIIRFTAETVSTWAHDQVLVWWAEFNYGNRDIAPWPRWATEPPEDLKASADLMVSFGTALDAFAKYKIPVDLAALCERFKIPILPNADIPPLEAPPPPPSPFGPNGNGGAPPPPPPGHEPAPGDTPPPTKARRAKSKSPSRKGLLDGQKYADDLATTARERARAALASDLKAIRKAIDGGDSFEEIRDRLASAYQSLSPTKIAKVMGDALAMGDLAGRAALQQDT